MFTRKLEFVGGAVGTVWAITNAAGKVVAEGSAYSQDVADRQSAEALWKLRQDDAKRQKRNAAARARSDAMRSVGMRRNRDGSWE